MLFSTPRSYNCDINSTRSNGKLHAWRHLSGYFVAVVVFVIFSKYLIFILFAIELRKINFKNLSCCQKALWNRTTTTKTSIDSMKSDNILIRKNRISWLVALSSISTAEPFKRVLFIIDMTKCVDLCAWNSPLTYENRILVSTPRNRQLQRQCFHLVVWFTTVFHSHNHCESNFYFSRYRLTRWRQKLR